MANKITRTTKTAQPAAKPAKTAAARKPVVTRRMAKHDPNFLQSKTFPLGLWALGLTALLVLGTIWFMMRLGSVMLPFMLGFVLAYLLQPAVNGLHDRGLPKGLAVSICIFGFLGLTIGLFALGGPLLVDQLQGFVSRAPAYAHVFQDEFIPRIQDELSARLGRPISQDDIATLTAGYSDRIATLGMTVSQKVLGGISGVMGVLGLLVFAPVVAFYLLLDWRHILDSVIKVLPTPWQADVSNTASHINKKLAAYLRGQITVCVLLGIFYGATLTAMGLELGWAIGFATGLLGFIPIVGAVIGAAMMLGMALVQFQLEMVWPYVVIGIIFFVGQGLENYVLTPQLVGKGVGIHPLWVMFALLAGGSIAGLLGMLVALPMAIVASEVIPPFLATWRNAVEDEQS